MGQLRDLTNEQFLVLFREVVDYDVLFPLNRLKDPCHVRAVCHSTLVDEHVALVAEDVFITV